MVPWFSSDPSAKKPPLFHRTPTESPLVERRGATRFDTDFGAFFHPVPGNEQFYSGRVKNVAQGGIALVTNRPFEPATRFVILLSKPAEVRLIRSVPTPDGHWVLGCAFTQQLKEEEVSALLAKYEKAGSFLS